MAKDIRILDTLSRDLVPLPVRLVEDKPVLHLYVCGVTPYEVGHMGHAFTFSSFDILIRYLERVGVRVRYVQNITDIDDPLFERARRDGVKWQSIAQAGIESHLRDMRVLGMRSPEVMPRPSQEIPEILQANHRLYELGAAYQSDALYFSARAYPHFGELSCLSRRAMLAKLRADDLLGEIGPGKKREPLDFPLWRSSAPDEPSWPSEFGPGRPGWHIECSVMAAKYLDGEVDIHGGGSDLIFSHHEAERAQGDTLNGGEPMVKAWMHVGMVKYRGHKMSKSLGNLIRVEEVIEQFPPAALRLYLASHHYRPNWSFQWPRLNRFARLAERAKRLLEKTPTEEETPSILLQEFDLALADDLNTPRAVRLLEQAVMMGRAVEAREMLSVLVGEASLG